MNSGNHFVPPGLARGAEEHVGIHCTHGERLNTVMISFGHPVVDRLPAFASIDALKNSGNVGSDI